MVDTRRCFLANSGSSEIREFQDLQTRRCCTRKTVEATVMLGFQWRWSVAASWWRLFPPSVTEKNLRRSLLGKGAFDSNRGVQGF